MNGSYATDLKIIIVFTFRSNKKFNAGIFIYISISAGFNSFYMFFFNIVLEPYFIINMGNPEFYFRLVTEPFPVKVTD